MRLLIHFLFNTQNNLNYFVVRPFRGTCLEAKAPKEESFPARVPLEIYSEVRPPKVQCFPAEMEEG